MAFTAKQRKYKLTEYMECDFPLFVGKTTGVNHVLHVHDFTELVIVEYGKGIHFTETLRHQITAGDILIIPQGMKHGYENTEMLSITNIIFAMSLFDSFLKDFKNIPGFYSLFLLNPLNHKRTVNKKCFFSLEPNEIAFAKQLISKISKELHEKSTGYRSVCIVSLAELIIFLSRKASKHNLPVHTRCLAEVLCYMEKNSKRKISLAQLSRMVNLSPRSFQRIFRSYMGSSPFYYLINIRVQHAKKLLEKTELNISEVACAAGFSSSAYFTRQFKKIIRISPLSYRKQLNPTLTE